MIMMNRTWNQRKKSYRIRNPRKSLSQSQLAVAVLVPQSHSSQSIHYILYAVQQPVADSKNNEQHTNNDNDAQKQKISVYEYDAAVEHIIIAIISYQYIYSYFTTMCSTNNSVSQLKPQRTYYILSHISLSLIYLFYIFIYLHVY